MTKVATTPDEYLMRVQRALARARMWNAKSWKMGRGWYRVKSATETGSHYEVTIHSHGVGYGVTPHHLCCNCAAGVSGQPCRHGAKVALRLEREGKEGGRKRAPTRVVFEYTVRSVTTEGVDLFAPEPERKVTLLDFYE